MLDILSNINFSSGKNLEIKLRKRNIIQVLNFFFVFFLFRSYNNLTFSDLGVGQKGCIVWKKKLLMHYFNSLHGIATLGTF